MQLSGKHPGEQSTTSWWQQHRPKIQRTLGMVLATGVLLYFARVITPAPYGVVFVLVGVIALPIWQYRIEYLLFNRRLVLAGAVQPASRIRSLLWRGGITRVIQAVVSMFLAGLLLALVSPLAEIHGYVIALVLDGLFLSLMVGYVTRKLEVDIQGRHLGAIARRWPLLIINCVVLTGAIMMLDFFIVGAPDTRHLAWNLVAEQAFTRSWSEAGSVLWGISAGVLASIEALSWHFSQLVIPNLPDLTLKIMAWLVFLVRAATVAWLYTALLLGICVFLDNREERRAGRVAESMFSFSFFLTIIVLALPFFYASIKLSAVDPVAIKEGVSRVADLINPCKPDEASRAQLVSKLDKVVNDERQNVIKEVDSSIDQGLKRIFPGVEAGIDDYLDWYFTVSGEYQRLWAVITADAAAATSEKLEEYLFVHSDFEIRLADLDSQLEQITTEWFANTLPYLDAELDNAPCDIGRVDLAPLLALDRVMLGAPAAAASGVGVVGVASKALAKKTAAAVAGKVAARKSIQSGAALASKALAKKGTSAALLSTGVGTTVCAPAGPVAVLCGVTAGLVTWLTVDKGLVELDEVFHREEMRADILKVLAGQQAELAEQLRQKHHIRVDRMAAQVSDAVQKSFIPYEHGMGHD